MGKLLVIASVVISLATAGLGFVNKGALGKTKEDLAASETAKQAAETKTATAEKTLKAKTDELATATAEKEQAVTAAATAEKKATDAQAALSEATGKVSTIETELAQVKTELAAEKEKSTASAGTVTPAQPDQNAELLTQLQEKETLIAKLQNELETTKGGYKELQTKEQLRVKAQLIKGTEGRVLAVNPAWNFVVLNLGDKQGVANNTELLVKRGTRYLGKVRITSVEPSTSIADIVANSMPQGTTITPGDNVIFQGDDAAE